VNNSGEALPMVTTMAAWMTYTLTLTVPSASLGARLSALRTVAQNAG
jgi:hypothetical protein